MKKYLKGLILICILALMLVTACGKETERTEVQADQTEQVQEENATEESTEPEETSGEIVINPEDSTGSKAVETGQHLNAYSYDYSPSLDPANLKNYQDKQFVFNILEPLVLTEIDESGDLIVHPGAAKVWKANFNSTVYTFTIRDFNWSDGTPVSAYDYEYGIKRVMDASATSVYQSDLFLVDGYNNLLDGKISIEEFGVKALDDKTLEIRANIIDEYPVFSAFAHPSFLPARKDLVEQHGALYGTAPEYTVSNGPFLFDSITSDESGSSMVFKKNMDYWNGGAVALDIVNVKDYEYEEEMMEDFEGGILDEAYIYDRAYAEFLEQSPEFNGNRALSSESSFLAFNMSRVPEAKVRRAISAAIDRSMLSEYMYPYMTEPVYSAISPVVFAGSKNYASTFPDNMVDKLLDQVPDPKALLTEGLGGADPATTVFELMTLSTSDYNLRIADFLKQELETKLGVQVNIKPVNDSEYNTAFNGTGEFDMAIFFTSPVHSVPGQALDFMLQIYNSYPGLYYSSDRFDDLFIKAAEQRDDGRRIQLYHELDELLVVEEAALVPLLVDYAEHFSKNYVQGYSVHEFVNMAWRSVHTEGR
ncbi:MAG: peptide ABC transporter substrate-binding protein [Tissierellia bacterium]|nr:peptide ABC transporter substrate-binding protein [Tissierellia bacterium]